MSIHISNKKVNDIHVGSKKVLSAWIGTDRVYLASTLSMLIKGYTEKSGDSLLSANTPLKFTGENLWDEQWELGRYGAGGIPVESNVNIRCKNFIEVEPNKTYFFGCRTNGAIHFFNSSKVFISGISVNANSSFTTTQDTKYIRFYCDPVYGVDYMNDIIIAIGSTAPTTFEPYHETFYNPTEGFSLNGFNNIYDTFNTINGELTKKFGVVDLGTLTWTYNKSGRYFRSSNIEDYSSKGYDTPNVMICSGIYTPTPKTIGASAIADKELSGTINAESHYIAIKDLDYTDTQAFKQAMSGVFLVYELATPQTYQKKPKTLPQWVKHVFDSSGRELEATITQ